MKQVILIVYISIIIFLISGCSQEPPSPSDFPVSISEENSIDSDKSTSNEEAAQENDFAEAEYPDIPYPEVVDGQEQEDGTLVLTVNAVYPYENTSKLFSHRVVVRPLADGGFQYVSN